jgi:Flp pilus assembly protein CpaB
MAFAGLLVALVAGLLLWTRWNPASGPSAAPQARPAQTIQQVNAAVGRIEALQKQQEDQLKQVR